jgi:hypothetical protein
MTQVIKFPELRPPSRGGPVREPPPPSQFRRSSPAIIAAHPEVAPQRRSRKRLFLWFGVAVALHAALLLCIWLMPPLRIPWTPSPDAWVQVVSVPQKAPDVAPAPPAMSEGIPSVQPLPEKPKARRVAPSPASEPSQERIHGN